VQIVGSSSLSPLESRNFIHHVVFRMSRNAVLIAAEPENLNVAMVVVTAAVAALTEPQDRCIL